MTFDYIIVGAGSAGCVLANRLSACGKYTVALIEAGGPDRSPWIHIPVGYFKTMGNPNTDWCYRTEPDPGLNGRSIPWPRGKVLGGCSSINGLLYVRGQPEDYDHWRDLGNPGWGWDEVLPLFKRSESWLGEHSANASGDRRGTEGELMVSPTRVSRESVDAWRQAAIAAGYPENPDYNGLDQHGVGMFQLTSHRGRRCSTAVAFLQPARARKNLHVFTGAQTERLLFEGRRAVGVVAGGREFRAGREVVLSAGAIGSPQILMLSGIGPAPQLQEHGIAVHHALAGVGENLQDHLQARPIYKCSTSTINVEINNIFKQAAIALRYALWRTGPMTMAASLGTAFLKSDPAMSRADIQFHIQPFSADSPAAGPHPFSAFTASVLQMRPESAGRLQLRSADYRDHPAIHPNYLATETDQRTLVEGIKIARRIAAHEPLASQVIGEHAPGPGIAENDDAAILDWARSNAVTIYHPTGTCKMGDDASAVVDHRLRVHGVEGLRVADCSIMPLITSGNTNAPAIMIGEKCSDLLLADARA